MLYPSSTETPQGWCPRILLEVLRIVGRFSLLSLVTATHRLLIFTDFPFPCHLQSLELWRLLTSVVGREEITLRVIVV